MKTQTTTRKQQPRKRRRNTPQGLAMLFDALQTQKYRHYYGSTSANTFAHVPTAFLRARDRGKFVELLQRVADREYPGGEFGPDGDLHASECVNVAPLSAFWAGVATAWYAMTALNGKAGAR